MLRFGHIELFVADPTSSAQWYSRVLGAQVTSVQADGRFVWVRLGDTEILLRPGQGKSDFTPALGYQAARVGFVLYTDDLSKTVKELTDQGLAWRGTDGSPGCPTFRDPDGNWFQLVNPDDHAK